MVVSRDQILSATRRVALLANPKELFDLFRD